MEFEWDETKDAANFAKHRIRFMEAKDVFDDPKRIERVDRRRDYGEERRQTIGEVDGRVVFVVYTLRGGRIRLISARSAHDHEKIAYRKG